MNHRATLSKMPRNDQPGVSAAEVLVAYLLRRDELNAGIRALRALLKARRLSRITARGSTYDGPAAPPRTVWEEMVKADTEKKRLGPNDWNDVKMFTYDGPGCASLPRPAAAPLPRPRPTAKRRHTL